MDLLDEIKTKYKRVMIKFKEFAFAQGCKVKVAGDDAYVDRYNNSRKHVKLWSAKNGKLQISVDGKRVEIPYDFHK